MKNKLFIIVFLIFTTVLYAQSQISSKTSYKISCKQAIDDINYMKKLIFDIHINISDVCDTSNLISNFDKIKNLINDSIYPSKLFQMLLPIFGQINDGHCYIDLPLSANDYFKRSQPYLPLSVIGCDSSLYIYDDKTNTIPLQSKLISINNISADTISKVLQACINSDGNNSYNKKLEIYEIFEKYFPLFFEIKDSNTICYEKNLNNNIDTISTTIKSFCAENHNYFPKNRINILENKNYYTFASSKSLKTSTITIKTFLSTPFNSYNYFLRKSFAQIAKQKDKYLILDLRSNQGGYIKNGKILLRYLMPDEFVYIDNVIYKSSSILKNHLINEKINYCSPNIAQIILKYFSHDFYQNTWQKPDGYIAISPQKKVNSFKNKFVFDKILFVLIDGNSSSTTGLVINELKKRPKTFFFGTPAACTYCGSFGQTENFELKNSKIIVGLSTIRLSQCECEFSNEPFKPDYIVDECFYSPLQFVINVIEKLNTAHKK